MSQCGEVVIYLGGGIANLNDAEVHDWRKAATKHFDSIQPSGYVYDGLGHRRRPPYYITLDPTRRDYRDTFCTPEISRRIVKIDKADIDRADILLAYCPRPSWGTAMEILYAFERNKWVVVVCPEQHPSPWLIDHCDVLVKTLEEAYAAIENISPEFP